ncbi:hypothetical protein A3D88_04200 [Candidatus Peribacteria bacterium RIFCSPHIGHO2_02_FULL_52_16]|nr:MAG: hypothetical protein A2706_00945 [Candidatus Peribacteria bacterium RIFCSPHIGHO2_01_FULL_51_35]OGJ60817.1 MAG: hypothetical protein A3D88_04200 [Candidatus Peribacteria bacterium RIFCSPHIGHO2_02_FULL_52_16]
MRLLFPLIAGLMGILMPLDAHAFEIPINFCGFGGAIGLSTQCAGGGATGLSLYAAEYLVVGVGVGFLAVAIAMYFQYAVMLIVGSNDENVVKESKIAYLHAITGGALVSMAVFFVFAFSPNNAVGPGSDLVFRNPIEQGFLNVIFYIKLILGGAMLINIVVQGVRLIVAQSEEDAGKAKKRLLYGFVGIAIVLLAHLMVAAAFPDTVAVAGLPAQGGDSSIVSIELVGIANFMLAFFALIAVIAIIVAGAMLVVSVNESLKDKAKNIVKTTVIALAVILAAFAIVNAFLFI